VTEIPVFRRTRRVSEADIDGLGHVNNTVWVRFVTELADAHSKALGFDWQAYRRIGGMWIVRRHELDYHAPAHADEEIEEETWIASMRGARSVRHARFRQCANGTRLLSARTEWAWVDTRTHRPKRIDPQVLAAFTPVERS
jgi:acyl-CoA thioester hydrolase